MIRDIITGNKAQLCDVDVLYLGPGRAPEGSGDPRVFQKQLTALAGAGLRVAALCNIDRPQVMAGVCLHPLRSRAGIIGRLRAIVPCVYAVLKIRPRILMVGTLEVLPMAVVLAMVLRIKLVYDAMEDHPGQLLASRKVWGSMKGILSTVVGWVEPRLGLLADLVVCADVGTADNFRRCSTVLVSHNFPELGILKRQTEWGQAIASNVNGAFPRLVYVGSLGWDRGLKQMLLLIEALRATYPSAELWLAGNWQFSEWQRQFDAMVEANRLSTCIRMVGAVPQRELGSFLRCFDLGVALLEPSRKHELNIATKQFDYMCVGLPFIATDLAPMREFAGRVGACVLVQYHDLKDTVRGCKTILGDPEVWRERARNGQHAIELKWNWETERYALIAAIRSLLK